MPLSYTSTFGSGQTLTAAALETMKTNIKSHVDDMPGTDIQNSTVTTAHLASPKSEFCIMVPLVALADALTTGAIATAVPGVGRNLTNKDFDVPVPNTGFDVLEFSIRCETSNAAGGTRNNDAQLWFGASTLLGSPLQFSTGAVVSATVSRAVSSSDTLNVRVNTDSASTDGVSGAVAYIFCKHTHQAS